MRFAAAMSNDVRLQLRYGLYAVSVLMVVIWGGLVLPLRGVLTTSTLLPALVLINLIVTTFYFMAALVLFEKGEGVLAALVVTPMRSGEYLASKAFSLTVLATAETLLIAAVLFRHDVQWPRIIIGSLLLGVFYACAGFVMVVRYDSINEFLMPSSIVVTLLLLPMLSHFGFVTGWVAEWLMAIHPAEPAMRWMRGGGVVSLGGMLLWCGAGFLLARREFHRFVVRA
jgi:fluoroquinolone transport system permease protein